MFSGLFASFFNSLLPLIFQLILDVILGGGTTVG